MSDQTPQSNSQQPIVIALVVVALLLAALVGVLIFKQNNAANAPQVAAPATPAATAPASTAPATPFDAKTATKVPVGQTPEQMLKAYNDAVIGGKFDVAYKLLPLDKQKSYGDATSYGTQLKGYGITSYKMGTPTVNGDSEAIVTTQVTPQMPISYTWNFKKVGSDWYVESRVMGGTIP